MTVAMPTYDNLRVQYSSDGVVWDDFGPVKQLLTTTHSRRFADNAFTDISAQHWRIVGQRKVASPTVKPIMGKVTFHKEGAALSKPKHVPFSFSSDQFYSMWISDQNLTVFTRGVAQSVVPIPHSGDEIPEIKFKQSLDTLILFHQNHPPHRIFRQGAHTEWDSRPQVFENIPLYDYDGLGAGGVNAQQQIRFRDYLDGYVFNITLGEELTNSINYTSAGVVAAVQTALRNLKNTSATGITVSGSGTLVTINFTGSDGNIEWPEMFCRTISGDGAAIAATLILGEPGGEPVMSASRGWPRCGGFYKQRGWMGGLQSRPSTFLASVAGDYFNYNARLRSADAGLDITLDGTDVAEIRHIVPGRHLQFFSASSESYLKSSPIFRDTLDIDMTTAIGVSDTIDPVMIDGPSLFVDRKGVAIWGYVFADGEQSYVAAPISIHASHLLPAPIDMARRPARHSREADAIAIPNADGAPAAILTMMRSQDITAFTRYTTPYGAFVAVGVENLDSFEFAVERGGEIYLEMERADTLLDAAVIGTYGADQSTIAGLDHLEGQEVAVVVDGSYHSRDTVVSGAVTIDPVAQGVIEVGLEPLVQFRTLAARKQKEGGGLSEDKGRIVNVTLKFEVCGAFEINVNGAENADGSPHFYEYVPERPNNTQTDEVLPLYLDQEQECEGFDGATARPDLLFRQKVPAPFHLKSINLELAQ